MPGIDPDALGFLLNDISRLIRASMDRAHARSGIGVTPGEARVLAFAARTGPVRQTRLAEQIVADGEGMSMMLRVEVVNAPSDEAATKVARSIAASLLVKTAVAGRDPNWGRFIAAAGNAGVPLDPKRITLILGGTTVYSHGAPTPISEKERESIFAEPEVTARIDLGAGVSGASMLTTDLTHEYVTINAEYTT